MWFPIRDKALTWGILQRMNKHCLCRLPLCKEYLETIAYLPITFSYESSMCNELGLLSRRKDR